MALLILSEALGDYSAPMRKLFGEAAGSPTCYIAQYQIHIGSGAANRHKGENMMHLLKFINNNLVGVVYLWAPSNDNVHIYVEDPADEFTMDMSKAGFEYVYKATPSDDKMDGILRQEPRWRSYEAL